MTFNLRNFLIFLALFITEVLIATFIKQGFIRFVFGDFLVVIMLYYFLKSFLKAKPIYIAVFVLVFAFTIEFIQLTSLLDWLGLRKNRIANLILGNTFEITDLVAYTFGIICVLLIEKRQ